jgi:hypothetical protein
VYHSIGRARLPGRASKNLVQPVQQFRQNLREAEDREYTQKKRELRLQGLEQILRFRREYSERITRLISIWLFVVVSILILQGLALWKFSLPESVLVTLVGTTTINIIGLLTIIVKFVFSPKDILDTLKQVSKSNSEQEE